MLPSSSAQLRWASRSAVSGLRASFTASSWGWRDEEGPWRSDFAPLFHFLTLLFFGKQWGVGQLCTLFPNLHFIFLANKPLLLLSLNTEVTPTPWLQKMHWFALLKKKILSTENAPLGIAEKRICRIKKKIPVGFTGEYFQLWCFWRWMSCAGVRGTHLPWTCGGRLWHKPWAWADPFLFFPLELCFIRPCPISSFCPRGVFGWGKISLSPTRCSEGCWVFSCQILGFLISIPKDQ